MNQSTENFLDYIGILIASDPELRSRASAAPILNSGISSIRIWNSQENNLERLGPRQLKCNEEESRHGWRYLVSRLRQQFKGIGQRIQHLLKKIKR